jgi:hypothetical protein
MTGPFELVAIGSGTIAAIMWARLNWRDAREDRQQKPADDPTDGWGSL